MWSCPKCVKPQTLMDQVLQFEGFWQEVHFVPYTQLYQYTSFAYRGIDIGLYFDSNKSRLTIIRVEPLKSKKLECLCGATTDVEAPDSGAIFFRVIQFFKKVIRPLPSPHIYSVDTLVQFTEQVHTREREAIVRDYVLRHVKRSYLDRRGDEQWLLWFRP